MDNHASPVHLLVLKGISDYRKYRLLLMFLSRAKYYVDVDVVLRKPKALFAAREYDEYMYRCMMSCGGNCSLEVLRMHACSLRFSIYRLKRGLLFWRSLVLEFFLLFQKIK